VVAIEVAELVTSDARVRGIRMEWESEAGVGNIRADRVQVQQVVLNLLVNAMDAVDAAGAGRPGPAGEPRAKEVRLHVGRHGDGRVRLAVSDSGNGFSRESLERLFEPFYTTKAHGMGMGLVLCRRIVEAHGGSMGVGASRDGGGQVWVEFPVEDEA
jgi:signal transduction histidine kinase